MESEIKIVYIAHPIGADTKKGIRENIKRVRKILKRINLKEPNVVPFAHYLVDLEVLDDLKIKEREKGIFNDHILLRKKFIDEMWLYGFRISNGMFDEIKLAISLNIRVVPKTEETKRALDYLLSVWQKE